MGSKAICFFLFFSKVVTRGLLPSANLSKLFYPIFYRSLEGTVVFRPLWPLWVLGKVLNSQTMSERWKGRLFKGEGTCSGSNHFLIFLKQGKNARSGENSNSSPKPWAHLVVLKHLSLGGGGVCRGTSIIPIFRRFQRWGWAWICRHPLWSPLLPLHVLKPPARTGGNFSAELSGVQTESHKWFETIYDIRPPSACISIYLVSLTYTLFFQNHKHGCCNFMWKCLRGGKLTPLWSLQPLRGC